MPYVTISDITSAIGVSDSIDDDAISVALDAAESMIDGYCERSFAVAGTAPASRVYPADAADLVFIDDATTVTLVETYDGSAWTAWDADDWQAEPLNARRGGVAWPYTSVRAVDTRAFPVSGQARVRVTGTWGWPATPAPVAQASIQATLRLWKRLDTPLGFGGGPDTGLLYVSRQIDGDVAQLLAPYRRGTGAIGGIA